MTHNALAAVTSTRAASDVTNALTSQSHIVAESVFSLPTV